MQSKKHSMLETLTSIAIGFCVSLTIQAIIMPLYGHHITLGDNLQMTAVFTVASIIRGYYVRRLFNWMHTR